MDRLLFNVENTVIVWSKILKRSLGLKINIIGYLSLSFFFLYIYNQVLYAKKLKPKGAKTSSYLL